MRTNGYLGASGVRFTKNHQSATYDKWNLRQWQAGVFRTSCIIAEDQNKVFDAKFHIGSVFLPFSDVGRIWQFL